MAMPNLPNIPDSLARVLPKIDSDKGWSAIARAGRWLAQPYLDPMVNQAQMARPRPAAGLPMAVPEPAAARPPEFAGSDYAGFIPNASGLPSVPQMTGQTLPTPGRPPGMGMGGVIPSGANPGVPAPIPEPNQQYRDMIARLSARAQNRSQLYGTMMRQQAAKLPDEYRTMYDASIPDVEMSMQAYNDALAGAATVAPQLEEILASIPAGGGAASATPDFASLFASQLQAAQGKK